MDSKLIRLLLDPVSPPFPARRPRKTKAQPEDVKDPYAYVATALAGLVGGVVAVMFGQTASEECIRGEFLEGSAADSVFNNLPSDCIGFRWWRGYCRRPALPS